MVTLCMDAAQRWGGGIPLGRFDVVHPPVGPKQWLGCGVEGGDGHRLHLTAPDHEAWANTGKFL